MKYIREARKMYEMKRLRAGYFRFFCSVRDYVMNSTTDVRNIWRICLSFTLVTFINHIVVYYFLNEEGKPINAGSIDIASGEQPYKFIVVNYSTISTSMYVKLITVLNLIIFRNWLDQNKFKTRRITTLHALHNYSGFPHTAKLVR